MFIWTLFCIIFFASLSQQQKDPLKNFCRLFGHQTTVVDRKLYVDGGLVNWEPLDATSLNYSSTWIKQADLDITNEGFPIQSTLAKNETIPSVHGGVLWPDATNKVVYMYGGEFGNEKPEDFKLWYYDIIYNTWNMSNASVTDIRRSSWGAGTAVQDRAEGYYYGGWLTNASVPGYGSQTPLTNMLVYNMLENSFRNQTGPDDIPRAEGVLLYLPVGDAGMLVYFGGMEFPYGNSTPRGVPMSDIFLYSIGDDLWYKETASGDVPEVRRRFCAGAAWADDRSSYNIYLFGGASVGEGVGYGDVYVLSLPSFTWIKFWPRPEDNVGKTYPHHSLTCDVIGNSQMIIQGGHFPNMSTECDVPKIYGQHGLDLGKQNPDGAKWALFNPNVTTYKVPTEIAETIGGGPTGGATALAPSGDWRERDLKTQFERPYTPSTREPTRYIPTSTENLPPPTSTGSLPTKSDKKAVIGGAVGGAVGGLFLVAAIGACVIFYRKRKAKRNEDTGHRPPSELPSQPIGSTKSPAISTQQMSYHSPSVTQYTHTPQGSPPPPSDHTWSQYGQAAPEYSGQQTVYTPQAQNSPHHRSPSNQSFNNHSLQSLPASGRFSGQHSPTAAAQEMPIVRSPPGFPNPQPHMQPLHVDSSIDPYFAQHPPRESMSTTVSPTIR